MKTPMDTLIKFIKDTKRVVLIGCTHKYDLNPKDIKKKFDKKFYFPYPDYGTRILLFKTYVEQRGGVLKDNFSLSTMAHLTEGYTAGSVILILCVLLLVQICDR
jgi:SpoVK/Ycf46/Vps4 family AAA+-type ATPase